MPLHVLFLEDDPNMVEFVSEKLQEEGFTYDHFENPRIALRELKDQPKHYDAIVCDWNMPAKNGLLSMNGDAFLTRIRRGARTKQKFGIPKDIPFVMCSSYEDPDKIEVAINLGANFYQIKSFNRSLQPMINYLNSLP